MLLRNFLYLDTKTVNDYLSTLEGSILEGAIEQTELEKREKGGKAGYKIIEGSAVSEKSTETKQKLAVTDAAKFQQLYEIMEEKELFRFVDTFDEESWSGIHRGDLLEVQAEIRLPAWFLVIQTIDDFSPIIDLMAAVGEDQVIDDNTRKAIDGLSSFGKQLESKPIPIIFRSVFSLGYESVANLSRQYLRSSLSDLQGETVILGKVQRILSKGEKHEAFSLLPAFLSRLPNLSKMQSNKMQQDMAKQNLTEIIKGPAIILAPVAVYR